MDSFELNKIIGAILGTLLFVMGIGFLAEGIYAPITGSGAGYDLPKPAATASTTAAAAPEVPLPELLAKADPQAGAETAKACQACHDFTENGPNKIGPNLYGVVGRPIASHPGYDYSDALKKFAGKPWTYDQLNTWLTSPAAMAPGTKMTFVGLPDPSDRADVMAYLRTLSHTPVAFPAVAAAPAAKPAPAAGKPAATAAPASPTAPAVTPPAGRATTNTAPAAGTTSRLQHQCDDHATPAATTPTTPAPTAPVTAAPAAKS